MAPRLRLGGQAQRHLAGGRLAHCQRQVAGKAVGRNGQRAVAMRDAPVKKAPDDRVKPGRAEVPPLRVGLPDELRARLSSDFSSAPRMAELKIIAAILEAPGTRADPQAPGTAGPGTAPGARLGRFSAGSLKAARRGGVAPRACRAL